LEHQENDQLALFEALQAKGWHLEDNCLYSPNGGAIQLQGNAYMQTDRVEVMYQRTKDILDDMLRYLPSSLNSRQYKNHIKDLESIVTTLKEFFG
jgi:hypothetical protein